MVKECLINRTQIIEHCKAQSYEAAEKRGIIVKCNIFKSNIKID